MTDRDAVALAAAGDPAGLAALYEAHAPALHRLMYRLTGSAQDADDLLHDLFVALPETLRRYEDRGRLLPWLRRIAVHLALSRLRHERRRREVPIESVDANTLGVTRQPTDDVFDLERALERLPEALRVVCVLRQLEGHSYDEIAELLSITSGAARVRHVRAIAALRAHLER